MPFARRTFMETWSFHLRSDVMRTPRYLREFVCFMWGITVKEGLILFEKLIMFLGRKFCFDLLCLQSYARVAAVASRGKAGIMGDGFNCFYSTI